MKKIILTLIILIELITIKIPTYVELNDLAIINTVAVIEEKNHYTIILKETIPIKCDQGITYEYKYYKKTAATIEKAYSYLLKTTKKKLYLKKTKSLITNVQSSTEIINRLDITPKTITHTKSNIEKMIKD
jgi:hypothetical protein